MIKNNSGAYCEWELCGKCSRPTSLTIHLWKLKEAIQGKDICLLTEKMIILHDKTFLHFACHSMYNW